MKHYTSVISIVCSLWVIGQAFSPVTRPTVSQLSLSTTGVPLSSSKNDNNNGSDDAWDDDVDYDKEFPVDPTENKSPDPSLPWDEPSNAIAGNSFLEAGKLGIKLDLGPMSDKETAEIKAAATELINEAVAAGIDDIEALRKKMKQEVEESRKRLQLQSEWNSQKAQEQLLSKIDKMTDNFLSENAASRKSTKLAAAADRSMKGRGSEMGSWGVLGQSAVVMGGVTGGASPYSSSSSSDVAKEETKTALAPKENRIVVIADTKQDNYAKQLIEPLTKSLQEVVVDLEVDVFAPTASLPLGGNNAAAVLIFLTSLSDASTVKNGLERLLRRTMMGNGKVAQPPTQLVVISTIGSERTNKMPYSYVEKFDEIHALVSWKLIHFLFLFLFHFSMQNLLGGKLEKRRQMEEAVMNVVIKRVDAPSLDYTICKLGEIKASVSGDFSLEPGDSLDGELQIETAVKVLRQAIALQTSARNATFSSVGGSTGLPATQEEWDEAFVPLAGPEIFRRELMDTSPDELGRLIEYMHEWGNLPESSKALTTPIRVVTDGPTSPTAGVVEQSVMQFLYLPTNTGSRYMSKSEERTRERESGSSSASSSSPDQTLAAARRAKEGGLEIMIEVTRDDKVRVRARRCNYSPGVSIKEISEETLLGRLKTTLDYWQREVKSK